MTIPGMQELDSLHRNICQAVGDPKRIQIIYALNEKPSFVTEIAELLNLPQPTVSRHLSILRQRGLVACERNGTSVIYRLTDSRIVEVLDTMRMLLREMIAKQASALEN